MGNLTTDFKRQNPLISDDEMGKLCWIWVSLILAFQCWTEPGNYIRFLFVVKIWLLVRVKGSVRCKSQEYLIQLKYYFWTWFQTKLSYISAVPRQKSKKHLLKSRVYFILSPNIVFAKDCDSNSNKTRIFSSKEFLYLTGNLGYKIWFVWDLSEHLIHKLVFVEDFSIDKINMWCRSVYKRYFQSKYFCMSELLFFPKCDC